MTSSNFKSYLYKVIVVTAIVSVLIESFFFMYPQYYFTLFPYLILFFVVSTFIIHFLLTCSTKLKPQKFVRYFMMITGGKLFLYIIVLAVVAYKIPKSEVLSFAISFFIFYATFTLIEISSVLKVLKNSTSGDKDNK